VAKRGRRYLQARAEIDAERLYHPLDAVRIVKSQELTRFDPTIEVHIRLGVNVRHADQQLRGTISLPQDRKSVV
jgi:large subunit ribosomal protein L1